MQSPRKNFFSAEEKPPIWTATKTTFTYRFTEQGMICRTKSLRNAEKPQSDSLNLYGHKHKATQCDEKRKKKKKSNQGDKKRSNDSWLLEAPKTGDTHFYTWFIIMNETKTILWVDPSGNYGKRARGLICSTFGIQSSEWWGKHKHFVQV